MPEKLTKAERHCCHMNQWEQQPFGALEAWRKEFREIERSEHCRDCPMFEAVRRG